MTMRYALARVLGTWLQACRVPSAGRMIALGVGTGTAGVVMIRVHDGCFLLLPLHLVLPT